MARFELWQAFVLIVLGVAGPYAAWDLSRSSTGRTYLKLLLVPFALQCLLLFMVVLVEYSAGSELYTPVRVICLPGSLLFPYALQVFLLCRAPVLRRLSSRLLRILTFGFFSFFLTLLGLATALFLLDVANLGVLGD